MKQIYFLLGLAFLFASCNRDLNLVSQDTITDATFWQTPAEFELAANNLYMGLDQFGFGGEEDDMASDIAFNFPNSISNGSYLPTATQSQWTTSYSYIRSANDILAKGSTSTDTSVQRFVAEAQFFRAWYYWKLLEVFGGVPLITKVLNTGDTALFTPRSTQSQTVDFILSDLATAENHLPAQSDLSDPEIGRITIGAAEALSARVALFEGTWEEFHGGANADHYLTIAAASAAQVINSGTYALYNGSGAQSYRYNFIEAGNDSRECILDRRYARGIFGQSYPYDCNGNGYNATRKLEDMYLDTNGLPITSPGSVFQGYTTFTSEFQMRDPRMTQTMTIPGTLTNRVFYPVVKVANWPDVPQRNFNTGYILYKYMSEDPIANNSGQNGSASLFDFDKHLIRYAEVLLIYAEAKYELNGAISDNDLDMSINVIRDRVNMPHLTNAFVAANNLNMETEIRRERTVELALEGFRYDDLRRWKTAETELPEDIKGIKIVGTSWQTYPLYSAPIYQNNVDANGFMIVETNRTFDPNKDYWWPLPTQEVAFYTASGYTLTQNPGW